MLSRVGALDEVRRPAVAAEQALELLVADAGQDGGVVDLVAVEVKDGQHRAVADRIEELVDVPRGGQRAGFRLRRRPPPRRRSGRDCRRPRRRRARARSPARRPRGWSRASPGVQWLPMPPGKENCLKNSRRPVVVLALFGINLGVCALEVGGPRTPGAPCPGPAMKIMSRSYFLISRLRWI